MGVPYKDEADKLKHQVFTRLTDEDVRRLDILSNHNGMKRSAFLRHLLWKAWKYRR